MWLIDQSIAFLPHSLVPIRTAETGVSALRLIPAFHRTDGSRKLQLSRISCGVLLGRASFSRSKPKLQPGVWVRFAQECYRISEPLLLNFETKSTRFYHATTRS